MKHGKRLIDIQNNKIMKTYILQKDFPHLKVGEEFVATILGVGYESSTKVKTDIKGIDAKYLPVYFHKEYVENNPEWFLPKI